MGTDDNEGTNWRIRVREKEKDGDLYVVVNFEELRKFIDKSEVKEVEGAGKGSYFVEIGDIIKSHNTKYRVTNRVVAPVIVS